MVVAAIQLNAELGNVQHNFSKAIELVRQAAGKHAEIIVLPEFFTSAMALSPLMEDVARRNMELDIPRRFLELAGRYRCIIAGSYLNIISGNIYNSMLLQFPDGERFVHNKDIPTQFENRYYTYGDHHRSRHHVGVALCWEMIRTQTVLEMPLEVRIIAAGSCWWDVPRQSGAVGIRNYNHELNRTTPSRFAEFLGIPVIHASHVGIVTGLRNSDSDTSVDRQLIGTTQIVNHEGQVSSQLDISDGDAILVDEIEIPENRTKNDMPNGFWTVELPSPYIEAWNRENQSGQAYYDRNRMRMSGELTT